ncbi:MAG: preprotein translocase subunit SecY [Acidobacteria bacterium]|nr:MAG: preprotein translocase subunit SecY [Acidobacteriota bacterium]
MIESLRNIFKIPELRNRVLFTFSMLAVYQVGGQIPTPGVNTVALQEFFRNQAGTVFGYFDMFAGGNFSRFSIFALGIMPYISASIILQLLTVIWPYLEKLSKEGEVGRKKIVQYTRYGTVVLSVVQSMGIALWLENISGFGGGVVLHPGWGFRLMTVLTLTTGTAFIMWLGEQITDRGIGNGISLIIFSGIIVNLPQAIFDTFVDLQSGSISLFAILALVVVMMAVIAIIVFVERAQRRIPVQYARRVVGRKVYGGQATHLPLRVNTSGVIPVIFASSLLTIPQTVGQIVQVGAVQRFSSLFSYNEPLYNLAYFCLILFFCYFYTSIIFNPVDTADNLKKYGGFIPGIRPGKRTAEYIDKVLTRLTFAGAIYLGLVALLPVMLISGMNPAGLDRIPLLGELGLGSLLDNLMPSFLANGMGVKFFFGGTSLLIVVGVAMDTVQQVESQLIMRHYEGFLKGSRVRGRR